MNTAASTLSFTSRSSRLLIALAAAAWLAACGGGGGAGGPSSLTPDASHADADGHADGTDTGTGTIDDAASAPAPELAAGDRSLSLVWEAPLTNEDGSPLNDLAGYRIYYGSRSGSYGASVAVNNPAALSHRLESLAPGTYYVVVKAVNSAGAQSVASPEASKTIQ